MRIGFIQSMNEECCSMKFQNIIDLSLQILDNYI